MTKRVKWSVTAAIVLMIAGMIAYPQIKSRMKASKDAAEVVPPAGSQVRKQVLNINAEVLKYQSLSIRFWKRTRSVRRLMNKWLPNMKS